MAKNKPAATAAARRFELVAGSSKKYWEVSVEGAAVVTRYGRIGTDGHSTRKAFASAKVAGAEAEKLVRAKTKKGYSEKTKDAPGARPTTRSSSGADATWFGRVSVDSSHFPMYLCDARAAAGLTKPAGRKPPRVVKHHFHDFRIDFWKVGSSVIFGEYYLEDDDALESKSARAKFGRALASFPAYETKRLGKLRVESGAMALVHERHAPKVDVTEKDIAAASGAKAVRCKAVRGTDLDGDLALVPLGPGDYEIVLEHLGTSSDGPIEHALGEFETRTTIRACRGQPSR